MKKELLIGKKDNHQVYLDIELNTKNPLPETFDINLKRVIEPCKTLSISAHSKHWAGQAINEIKSLDEYYIPKEQLDKLVYYWETYHLNDMRAYCIHQKQWDRYKQVDIIKIETETWRIKDKKIAKVISLLSVNNSKIISTIAELKKYNYGHYTLTKMVINIKEAQLKGIIYQPKTDAEKSWFDNDVIKIKTESKMAHWTKPMEHPEGILGKRCNECGYEYGTKWLLEYLPDEVEDFVNQLNVDIVLHEIDSWMLDNEIECSDIVTIKDDSDIQNDFEMDHWLVTFKHKDKEFSFKFSTGYGHRVDDKLIKPLSKDVFDLIMNDISIYYELNDYMDLAKNYGYPLTTNKEILKVKKIYKELKKQEFKMKKLIGENLIQQYIDNIL